MKIIDPKRRDYFDTVLISDEPVWIRFPYEEDLNVFEKSLGSSFQLFMHRLQEFVPRAAPFVKNRSISRFRYAKIKTALICFCGEFFVIYSYNPILDLISPASVIYASSPSEMVKLQNALAISHNQKNRCITEGRGYSWFSSDFSEKSHKRLLEFLKNSSSMAGNINLLFETPIVAAELGESIFEVGMSGTKIFVNPLLSKYNFQKIIPPWDAAQRIERFLSNDLVKEPLNDFKMTDELKRDSKGMNEWSFKQCGPKKRKNKGEKN